MARLGSFSRDLQVAVDATLSAPARQKLIAQAARQALGEAQAQNRAALGTVPAHQSFVDGRPSEALETVDPDRGTIVFVFDVAIGLFAYIGELLVTNSPVLTGEYQRSHRLFADGVEVDGFDPRRQADEWIFTTPLPYARKIERGQSDQAPDGVYEGVAALAAARYGNLAAIRYTYREVNAEAGRNPAISVRLR